MPAKNGATIRDVYELVERTRLELKQDMLNAVATVSMNQGTLEKKFDELEAGRLTRAEEHIRNLQVQNATANTKLAVLVFVSAAIVSAIVNIIVPRIFR